MTAPEPTGLPQRASRRCLLFGALLYLASMTALAQAPGSPASSTPWWATSVIGVVLMLYGAYMRALEGRIERVEKRGDTTFERLLSEYHDKGGIEAAMRAATEPQLVRLSHVERSLEALHKRMDRFGIARVTGQQPAFRMPDEE